MDKLSCMKSFVAVVETGSFSEAAVKQRQSASYISKQVAQLEIDLGVQLFNRTTRRVHLTDEGRNYAQWCQNILSEIEDVEGSLQHHRKKPTGLLRLSVPTTIGRVYMPPLLNSFLKEYPDVEIEMDLSDECVDLIKEGYDVALRVGAQLEDSTLVAKKIATACGVFCASPNYIAKFGLPKTKEDLYQHNFLAYTLISRNSTPVFDEDGKKQMLRIKSRFSSNNGEALCQAALEGAGIGHFPTFVAGKYIAEGRLIPIRLEDEVRFSLGVHVVYPQHRYLPSKVRAFIDYISREWAEGPPWDQLVEAYP